MNSSELDCLARSCPVTRLCFRGVYARDTLPKLRANSTYICNLDTSSQNGSHWIAIYKPKSNDEPIEYFDSYGLYAPAMIEQRFGDDYYLYNERTIQHFISSVCGQYALYYIWQRPIQKCMNDVLVKFNNNGDLSNDFLVNRMVKEHFGVDLDVVLHRLFY